MSSTKFLLLSVLCAQITNILGDNCSPIYRKVLCSPQLDTFYKLQESVGFENNGEVGGVTMSSLNCEAVEQMPPASELHGRIAMAFVQKPPKDCYGQKFHICKRAMSSPDFEYCAKTKFTGTGCVTWIKRVCDQSKYDDPDLLTKAEIHGHIHE